MDEKDKTIEELREQIAELEKKNEVLKGNLNYFAKIAQDRQEQIATLVSKESISELCNEYGVVGPAVMDEKDTFVSLVYVFQVLVEWRDRALKAEADYAALTKEHHHLKESFWSMEESFTHMLVDRALEKKVIDDAEAEKLKTMVFNEAVEYVCQKSYDRGLAMNSYNAEACIMRQEIDRLKRLYDAACHRADVNHNEILRLNETINAVRKILYGRVM